MKTDKNEMLYLDLDKKKSPFYYTDSVTHQYVLLAIVLFHIMKLICHFFYSLIDPFVKVYLLQEGRKISKKKTSIKRDDTNPIFNEAMIFSVPAIVLQVTNIREMFPVAGVPNVLYCMCMKNQTAG